MKYEAMIQAILKNVGGEKNVLSAAHCMTRLRLTVQDEAKVDLDGIKKIPGVSGCVCKNGQYQIVIGTAVADVYDEFVQLVHPGKANAELAAPEKTEKLHGKALFFKPVQMLMDTIAGVFIPLIGVVSGAGLARALLIALVQFGLLSDGSQTYTLLYMFTDAAFYFLPVFLAFTSAKRFNCNPYIAAMLGAILIHPTFMEMVAAGEPIQFMGLPVTMAEYSYSFLPVIMIVYAQSWVEKYVRKICPKAVSILLVPLLVVFITGTLGLVVLGPIGDIIGKGIGGALNSVDALASWLCPVLIGALFPLLVLTGTHHSLMSAQAIQYLSVGYCTVYIPGALCSNMATAGAAFAVAVRSKDKDTRSVALSATISAICGITEPALYGISVKYKTPLVATIVGGAFGGLFTGLLHVRAFAMAGTNIFSLPIFIGEGNNFVLALLMLVIAMVISFVVALVTFRESK